MTFLLITTEKSTTETLALHLKHNKRYIKNLIKETNDDLLSYQNGKVQLEIDFSGAVSVNNNNSEELLRIFYALKLEYLKETHEFKIIHLLLQNDTISTQKMTEQLFLSLSYTRRIIKKMNAFLVLFDFQIIEKNGCCAFDGNELSIRLFLYAIMNDSYHSLIWPYPSKDLESPLDLQQSIRIILTILSYRKKKNIKLPKISEHNRWVINQMKEVYNIVEEVRMKNTFFEDVLQEETIEDYLIFFTHICTPHVISKDIKLKLGRKFIYSKTDDNSFSRNLSQRIIEEFQLEQDAEKTDLISYYLMVLESFHEFMNTSAIFFEKLTFPPVQLYHYSFFSQPRFREIQFMLEDFFEEENRLDIIGNKKLQQYFCTLIYTLLQTNEHKCIYIYLHFTKTLTAQYLVQEQLENIYNSQTVTIISCFEKADLVITDCLNFERKSKKEFFYFMNALEGEQWDQLLKKINKLLLGL